MKPDFRSFQFALARQLRDVDAQEPPSYATPAQIAMYRDDMLRHVADVLTPVFVRAAEVLGPSRWHALIRAFVPHGMDGLARHRQVPFAFVRFLQDNPTSIVMPAWLPELVHFEWAQWAVATMDVPIPEFDARGDVLTHALVLNPACLDVSYDWPVQGIRAHLQPVEAQRTCCWIVRDAALNVRVVENNAVRAKLLGLLQSQLTGHDALWALAHWVQHPNPEAFVRDNLGLLAQLQKDGLVLGVSRVG